MAHANRIFIIGVVLLLLLNLGLIAAIISVRAGLPAEPLPAGTVAAPQTPAFDAPAVEVPPTPTIGLLPTAVPPPTTTTIAPEPKATSTPRATATAGARTVTHVVQAGEDLGGIAAQYGVSVEDIVIANGIEDRDFVRAGEELIIPLP